MRLLRPTVFTVLCWLLCAAPALAASPARIGSVDCAQGGVVVELSNPNAAPMRFTLLRDSGVVDSVVVTSGSPVRRVVPLAEGASAQITVRYGSSYTSSQLQRRCDAGTPAAAAVAPSARRAGERDALETKADVKPARSGDVNLEDPTPLWVTIALVLAGLLAAGGGAGALIRSRARRRATVAGPATAALAEDRSAATETERAPVS